jgi:methionyl-tRNA synthetase
VFSLFVFRETYEWFDISFDYFGRTTTPQQTQIAQDIFKRLHANGYLKEGQMEQLWCPKCQRYLADRYVTGTCPACKAPDARGDQCDACQKILDSVDLIDPHCKLCNSSPVKQSSTHLFLDLPKLTQELTVDSLSSLTCYQYILSSPHSATHQTLSTHFS